MASISQSTRGCALSYPLRLCSLCLKAKDASYTAQFFLPPQQPSWPHLLPCPIAPEARLWQVLSLLFNSQTQFQQLGRWVVPDYHSFLHWTIFNDPICRLDYRFSHLVCIKGQTSGYLLLLLPHCFLPCTLNLPMASKPGRALEQRSNSSFLFLPVTKP